MHQGQKLAVQGSIISLPISHKHLPVFVLSSICNHLTVERHFEFRGQIDMLIPPKLTPSAARRLAEVSADAGQPRFLRIAVLGGGCSGFQYEISLAEAPDKADAVIEAEGQAAIIDPISMPFLVGSRIDYEESLIGSRFVIDNPNAASSCGCGTSFSLAL